MKSTKSVMCDNWEKKETFTVVGGTLHGIERERKAGTKEKMRRSKGGNYNV